VEQASRGFQEGCPSLEGLRGEGLKQTPLYISGPDYYVIRDLRAGRWVRYISFQAGIMIFCNKLSLRGIKNVRSGYLFCGVFRGPRCVFYRLRCPVGHQCMVEKDVREMKSGG
jgi:hypothetical protein